MPVVMDRNSVGSGPSTNKPNKPARKPAAESGSIPPIVMIAAGAGLLLLFVALFHFFVRPLVPTDATPTITKVAPLPGFPDQPPYNTKEWQDARKAGRASFVSGIPPGPVPGANGAAK